MSASLDTGYLLVLKFRDSQRDETLICDQRYKIDGFGPAYSLCIVGGRHILFCSTLLELGNFLIWESLAERFSAAWQYAF